MAYVMNGPARVWWEEAGEGEPVLLAMGASFSSAMWHRAVPALAERHRVLTFDNRGIGRTTAPRHRFGIADLASDAFAVMDAAGVASAHVYGVSMGGLTAQEMALTNPARVRSLILGCTGATEPRLHELTWTGQLRRFLLRAMPRAVLRRLAPRVHHGPAAEPNKVAEDVEVIASTSSKRWALARQARAIAEYDSLTRIGSLSVPTLVLHGDADQVVPLGLGRQLAGLIPDARLVELAGAGHNFLADAEDLANAEVLEFLAAPVSGGGG